MPEGQRMSFFSYDKDILYISRKLELEADIMQCQTVTEHLIPLLVESSHYMSTPEFFETITQFLSMHPENKKVLETILLESLEKNSSNNQLSHDMFNYDFLENEEEGIEEPNYKGL